VIYIERRTSELTTGFERNVVLPKTAWSPIVALCKAYIVDKSPQMGNQDR